MAGLAGGKDDSIIVLSPADSPRTWCHPEIDGKREDETHPMRCEGSGRRRSAELRVINMGECP